MILFGSAEKAKIGVNQQKFRFTSKITDIHPVVTISSRDSIAHGLMRIFFLFFCNSDN